MHDEQRPREPEIAPELNALEQQLRRMTLATPRIDRDHLMYAAGQAAGTALSEDPGQDGRAIYDDVGRPRYIAGPFRAGRFWQVATCTMTAATLLLATMLVWQRHASPIARHGDALPPFTSQVFEQPLMVNTPSSDEPASSASGTRAIEHPSSGYFKVRYAALTRGIDAWRPSSQIFGGDGDSYNETPPTQRKMLEEFLPSRKRQINPGSSF